MVQSTIVTLDDVKEHLKIVSGIIQSRLTTFKIKMIWNYQKNFGKSNEKLLEYVVLTIQTVSATFYG